MRKKHKKLNIKFLVASIRLEPINSSNNSEFHSYMKTSETSATGKISTNKSNEMLEIIITIGTCDLQPFTIASS